MDLSTLDYNVPAGWFIAGFFTSFAAWAFGLTMRLLSSLGKGGDHAP